MKKQSTLNSFLNTSQQRYVPECFSLVWDDDNQPTVVLEHRGRLVKTANIRLRGINYQVQLYGDDDTSIHVFEDKCMFNLKAVSFLKSMLQKAIRRGFVTHALFACYSLLQLDYITLYRRLPIIMIEDVRLHDGFSPLVWYMIYNKPPSTRFVKWVLGLVVFLCKYPGVEDYDLNAQLPFELPQEPIVWSLVYRIAYGGLKGDIGMMSYIVSQLCSGRDYLKTPIESYHQHITTPTAWMYEAIDFHVYPGLLQGFVHPPEVVRRMMLCNSSSVNFRRPIQPYMLNEWKSVCHIVRNKQLSYFNSIQSVK